MLGQVHLFRSLTHGMKTIVVGEATRKPLLENPRQEPLPTLKSAEVRLIQVELWGWPWASMAFKVPQVIAMCNQHGNHNSKLSLKPWVIVVV